MFAVDGAKAYPDATGTLRLSYGTVKGYMEDGKKIPPYTVHRRPLRARRAAQRPAAVRPGAELGRRQGGARPEDAVQLRHAPTTSSAATAGRRWSTRRANWSGLIFDGNIQSLPGYFIYDEAINRAVSVDSRAILEALRKVYKADALANEIAGARRQEVDGDVGSDSLRPADGRSGSDLFFVAVR